MGQNVLKAKRPHSAALIPTFIKSDNEFKEPQKFSKRKFEINLSDINKLLVPLVTEICIDELHIDYTSVLGVGSFRTVIKGNWAKTDIAIKTMNT